MAGKRTISSAELEAECTVLERAVRSGSLASDEALHPHRPGGDENPATDARAWLSYYRHLHRLHAKAGGGGGTSGESQADAHVIAALRATPIRVELSSADADGTPHVVHVHPKSAHTLLHLTARDRVMGWLSERVDRLRTSEEPPDLGLLVRAETELGYQLSVFCSIVCHEGPGSPYADTEERPTPAAWTRDLDPVDMVRIVQAHLAVNGARLAALSALVSAQRKEPDGATSGRQSWGVFFAFAAGELGVSPEVLLRDRSLASVLAQVYAAGAAKQEAADRAREKAEAHA